MCIRDSLEISKKRCPDQSSAPKALSYGEKIAKIGPVDPEIIALQAIIKKEQEGLAAASIARDDPSPLSGMHRDHNALPSQTDRLTDRRTLTS